MNVNCFQVIEKEQKIISGFRILVVVCLINAQSVVMQTDIYRLCLFIQLKIEVIYFFKIFGILN